MSDTKEVKQLLKIRYGNMCMLTGLKTKLTYHHSITKRCEFKKSRNKIKGETIENGALLNEDIHCSYLHSVLERKCTFCYEETMLLILRYKIAIEMNDEEYIQWHYDNVFPRFLKILESRYIIGKGKCKKRKRVRK